MFVEGGGICGAERAWLEGEMSAQLAGFESRVQALVSPYLRPHQIPWSEWRRGGAAAAAGESVGRKEERMEERGRGRAGLMEGKSVHDVCEWGVGREGEEAGEEGAGEGEKEVLVMVAAGSGEGGEAGSDRGSSVKQLAGFMETRRSQASAGAVQNRDARGGSQGGGRGVGARR
eukprot:2527652-Rhodomonas_salina.3